MPEAKNMSTVQHGVAMKRPCVGSMVREEDTTSGGIADERSARDAKINRSRFLEIAMRNTEASRLKMK